MRRIPRFASSLLVILLLCLAWADPLWAAEKSSSYHAALESIRAEELGQLVGHLAAAELEGARRARAAAKRPAIILSNTTPGFISKAAATAAASSSPLSPTSATCWQCFPAAIRNCGTR